MHTTGDRGVSRLVSVLLSSASLSLSLLLSLTKHTCRFAPVCSLREERTGKIMIVNIDRQSETFEKNPTELFNIQSLSRQINSSMHNSSQIII